MAKRFPDLPPREQLKQLVETNEEADVAVKFTVLFGLLFEGKLKIGKVSSMLEVGRRIARKKYKNPLRIRVSSVDYALWAWLEETNYLARTKCQSELAEQVMARATELVHNRGDYIMTANTRT